MTRHEETGTASELVGEVRRLRRRVAELESQVDGLPSHPTVPAHHFPLQGGQTARAEAEHGEDFYRTILVNVFEGIAIIDADATIRSVSPSISDILGYQPDELCGMDFLSLVHAEDQRGAGETLARVWEHPCEQVPFEYRFRHQDGSLRVIECRAVNLLSDPEVHGVVANLHDVTENRRMIRALEESESKLRSLFDNVPAFIFTVDRDGRILFINHTLEGITREEAVGATVYSFLAAPAREVVSQAIQAVFETGQSQQYEINGPGAGGTTAWYACRLAPVHRDGKIVAAIYVSTDVSQARQAHEQIRLQSQLLDSVQESVMATDLDGRVIYWGRGAERLYGYHPAEVLGQQLSLRTPSSLNQYHAAPDQIADRWRHAAEHGCWRGRHEKCRRDGRAFHADSIISLVRNEDGEAAGFITIDRDVTVRVCAEQELAGSEARFRALFEHSYDVINLLSVEGNIAYTSASMRRVLGHDPDELVGTASLQLVHIEDLPQATRDFSRCLQTPGRVVHCTYRLRHKDGSYRTVEAIANNMLEVSGVQAVVLIFRDVTDRKRVEAERVALASLAENSRDFISLSDLDGRLTYVNQAGLELVGLRDLAAARGMTHLDLVPPQDMAWVVDEILPCLQEHGYWTGEHRFRNLRSGKLIPLDFNSYIVRNSSTGQAIGVGMVARDIAERRKAERQLRLTQFAVDQSGNMFLRIDPEARITYVNDATCQRLGYSRNELLRMRVWEIDCAWAETAWETAWRNLGRQGSSSFESSHRRRDGSLLPVEVTANYFNFDGGEFVFAYAVDISGRKDAERRLRETEAQLAHVARLSTVGELVAGIAHEINQPLHAVGTLAAACRNGLDTQNVSPAKLSVWLDDVVRAAIQAGDIVTRLKRFTRKTEARCVTESLNDLVAEAEKLVRFAAEQQQITLTIECSPDDPDVVVDRVQIQQVLANLLINAIEAIQQAQVPSRYVIARVTASDNSATVEVIDSGPGLTMRTEQLFEPFVSTKPDGLGLGLAISQSIMQSHKGTLSGRTRLEGGAMFEFTLPLDK